MTSSDPAPSVHVTRSAEATEELGARFAASLRPGDVVLLDGDMGSGKTTFVRGALRALGVAGRVTSPTFTLARRYEDGRIPVSHLDLHRVGELADDLEGELGPDRVTFVEWPPAGLEGRTVRFEHVDESARRVVLP